MGKYTCEIHLSGYLLGFSKRKRNTSLGYTASLRYHTGYWCTLIKNKHGQVHICRHKHTHTIYRCTHTHATPHVYAHTHTYAHIFMHTYAHKHIEVYMHMHLYSCLHVPPHKHAHTQVYVHTCLYTCTRTHTHTHMLMHTYAPTQTDTHTGVHAHKHTCIHEHTHTLFLDYILQCVCMVEMLMAEFRLDL